MEARMHAQRCPPAIQDPAIAPTPHGSDTTRGNKKWLRRATGRRCGMYGVRYFEQADLKNAPPSIN